MAHNELKDEPKLEKPRRKSLTNYNEEERSSPLMRHLNFAKQDSQSSIIEISKYPQFMDSRNEPHV